MERKFLFFYYLFRKCKLKPTIVNNRKITSLLAETTYAKLILFKLN